MEGEDCIAAVVEGDDFMAAVSEGQGVMAAVLGGQDFVVSLPCILVLVTYSLPSSP